MFYHFLKIMPKRKESILDFYELSVKDVIDKRHWDLPLVEKNAELLRVLAVLGGTDHVWVVDTLENRKLLGVITEGDVLKALAPKRKITYFGMPGKEAVHWEMHETADHIMSREPIICKPGEKVKNVLDKMATHRMRGIPVVENGKIVGEVTLRHLIVIMRHYFKAEQVKESKP